MTDLFGEPQSRIRVVNKRRWKGEGVYVGRPSPLGNPFSHLADTIARFRVATREESIARFEDHLRGELGDLTSETTIAYLDLLRRYRAGEELVLICWCKPAACHGDVIARFLEQDIDALPPRTVSPPPDEGYPF